MKKGTSKGYNSSTRLALSDHRRLKRLLEDVAKGTKESGFLREMIQHECAIWLDSPYISRKCSALLLISCQGDFDYWRRDELLLRQEDVFQIPSKINMKHRKIAQYLREFENNKRNREEHELKSAESFLASRWKYSRFSLRHQSEELAERFIVGPVEDGVSTTRTAYLACPYGEGQSVIRESAVGLKEYCQWLLKEDTEPMLYQDNDNKRSLYDFLAHDITIPTEETELVVVLDKRLYDSTPPSFQPAERPLRFHTRNFEEGLQKDVYIIPDFEQKNAFDLKGKMEKRNRDPHDEAALHFLENVLSFRNQMVTNEHRITFEDISEQSYLYHIKVGRSRPGIVFIIEWRKPWKPGQPA